ncbi:MULTISPECIES: hypothetical protein [unclassified Variovorax]|uniref:hypothetical protein n=1 Tax=unclassified Variovorax TaxID=663243 RepID=UPI003ECE0A89
MHPEDIEADPVPGELLVYRKGMKRVAVLVGPDRESYLIPLLDKVTLLDINAHGLLITGTEVHPARSAKGTGPMFPQTWWCEINPTRRARSPSPADARRREYERHAREMGGALLRRPVRRGKYEP